MQIENDNKSYVLLETVEHLLHVFISLNGGGLQFFLNGGSYFISLLFQRQSSFFHVLNVILKSNGPVKKNNNKRLLVHLQLGF